MFFSFSSLLTCWKILVKKTVPIPSRYRGRSWKVDHKTQSTTGGTKGTNQELVDTRVRFTLLELVHEESHKIVKRSQKRRKIGDNELRSQMCCLVVKLLHSLFTCLFTCLFVTLKLCFNIQSWCLHDNINCTQYYVSGWRSVIYMSYLFCHSVDHFSACFLSEIFEIQDLHFEVPQCKQTKCHSNKHHKDALKRGETQLNVVFASFLTRGNYHILASYTGGNGSFFLPPTWPGMFEQLFSAT